MLSLSSTTEVVSVNMRLVATFVAQTQLLKVWQSAMTKDHHVIFEPVAKVIERFGFVLIKEEWIDNPPGAINGLVLHRVFGLKGERNDSAIPNPDASGADRQEESALVRMV